jgi:hypothetical protein
MDPSGVTKVVIDIFCGGLVLLGLVSWGAMIYFGAIDRGSPEEPFPR